MQSGFKFKNENSEYLIVLCEGNATRNVALLICENTVCPFVTVRDLSERKTGCYDWAWGHSFSDFEKALTDYTKRLIALKQAKEI